MSHPDIQGFFDSATNTISYVVRDPDSQSCAVIDPVLDFDLASGRLSTESANRLIEYVTTNKLTVELVLETHAHADHLSGSPYVKEKLGGKDGIGAAITQVQEVFAPVFNAVDVVPDGSQFDLLLNDGDEFQIGTMTGRVMHTPGHTPACCTYVIGDAAFVGDTLFMPDFGTARCDFPGGDAAQLYDSMQRILTLPDATRLFMCHDYKAPGRDEFAWESSVAEERAGNIHLAGGVSRDEFVEFRQNRDATLPVPKLLYPALQVNIRAGALPPPDSNDVQYLKIPLKMSQDDRP